MSHTFGTRLLTLVAALGWLGVTNGCAAPQARSRVLSELDSVRESPAVKDAAQTAPQAYANANRLRAEAERAEQAGDHAGAQILGERALAAYERAAILARLGRAEHGKAAVEARLAAYNAELAELTEQEQRVRAETEALELRAQVARETSATADLQKASPERQKARREAARALLLQARLLCVSARLVEPTRSSLTPVLSQLDAADASTKGSDAYFEDAVKLRSTCLSELSQARRAASLSHPAQADADRLLTELSQAAYAPSRDDRGVAVTLRGVFGKGSELSPQGLASLQALSRVAAAHPEFPILVVLHSALKPNPDLERQRLTQVQSALQQAAVGSKVESAWAADSAPLIAPQRSGAGERNQRVEIVFVAKTAS